MKNVVEQYLTAIKKFIPEHAEDPLVGLDIGTNSCKIIELNKKGSSYELLNWGIEQVEEGDKNKAINTLLGKLSIPALSPATALSGKGTLIRYIDMPRMSLDDLRKSFSLESDKYFPFPQDQIYTDCYILDSNAQGNKMEVLVAASKKELVRGRIELLGALGLQPNMIGINSMAIANVFNVLGNPAGDKNADKKDVVALLDMGEKVCDLTILVNNLPRFTRNIFLGGMDLSKCVSNALGVSFREAEKLKSKPGEKLSEVSMACESALLNLVSEIRMSFDYFVTENNMGISSLMITGGASLMVGLQEALGKYLEMPVKIWNPMDKVELTENISKEAVEEAGPKLGVALGLALYQ